MDAKLRRWVIAFALAAVGAGAVSCTSDRSSERMTAVVTPGDASAPALAESPETMARMEELNARFVLPASARSGAGRAAHAVIAARPAIGAPIATAFVPSHGSLRPVVPPAAKAGVAAPATVSLPMRASAPVVLTDDRSRVAVSFGLRGASEAAAASAAGYVVYPGALRGADVLHRVNAEGTEDYVVFESKPGTEAIVYDVDVSQAAGLRLVSNTLEFLDEGGTPRLRVAPPYLVDTKGVQTAATIAVEGCAVDLDPRAPWGRAVTRPGARSCGVRVAWASDGYPAILDPSWEATGSMATARWYDTATALGSGEVLVAGGQGGSGGLSSAELYNASGAGSFAATGSLAAARGYHTATLLGSGKVLVAGGVGAASVLSSAEVYDPGAGTFGATASMAAERDAPSATLLASGKVLVAGGLDNSSNVLSSAEVYDPSGGTFGATGSMALARYYHTATLLGAGNVLVTGGHGNSGNATSSAEVYNPSGAGTFAATGAMGVAREDHAAALLGSGKVLVTGGYNSGSGYQSSAEIYNPSGAGSFAATGAMAAMRSYHTATLLRSGKVLVAGGYTGSVYLSSAELYNPTGAGTFGATAAMAAERAYQTATLLGSGTVLVVGGFGGGSLLASAELYEQASAGSACGVGDDCVSGVCEDGICCSASTSCSGSCMTCSAGTGACVSVTNGPDPDTCTGTMTCNGSGSCALKTGQACPGGGTSCASGYCSDGVCCSGACGSACDVCTAALGASADGTCSTAPRGYAGNPACGNGAACNGTDVTCPASCVSDSDCLPSDYCAANGSCQAGKGQGASCNTGAGGDCLTANCRECTSGYCVDGVCCDTGCTMLCQACAAALKQSGGQDGTCGPAKAQTNPHHDTCATSAASTCGNDGLCNGAGACSPYYPSGTSCGSSSCDPATNKAIGQVCDGAGMCANNPNGVSCGLYLCANASCPTTCGSDADCTPQAYCQRGVCVARGANSVSCTGADQCTSGFCVDGVCCDGPCAGQCEACDVAGAAGTCSPVSGAQHGTRAPCAGAGTTCGGTCNGGGTDCSYPTTACGSTCENGVEMPGTCNGTGACVAGMPLACQSFACNATTGACNTTCASDTDCSDGYACAAGACRPAVAMASCSGSVLVLADGQTQDCSPYGCASSGTCKTSCSSDDDCEVPNTCGSGGKCVVAPTAPAESSGGGCGVSGVGEREDRAGALVGLLGMAAVGGRRRRRAGRVGLHRGEP